MLHMQIQLRERDLDIQRLEPLVDSCVQFMNQDQAFGKAGHKGAQFKVQRTGTEPQEKG